jgi:ribosomal protein L11 methyltransferase
VNYISFNLAIKNQDQEIEIARLHQMGVESFVQNDQSLEAFINTETSPLLEQDLITYFLQNNISYTKNSYPQEDWNHQWEQNFQAVSIDGILLIRAPFHPADTSMPEELIISPRMAFGTGHHETTYMIIRWMMDQDLKDCNVLDFGCGTGILGIYAALKKAGNVCFIDYDELCVENTFENIALNQLSDMQVLKGSFEVIPEILFDFILANITRTILSDGLEVLSNHLNNSGKIALSGFLKSDESYMTHKIEECGLEVVQQYWKNEWMCIIAQKK